MDITAVERCPDNACLQRFLHYSLNRPADDTATFRVLLTQEESETGRITSIVTSMRKTGGLGINED
ncbi:MAG TPA: hypothetical protein GXX72_04365 [Clostridiaceae bacterium]|nr:hypothetical protein [Clostridiaceae bacterium]